MPGLQVVRCSSKNLAGEVAARYGASLICAAVRAKGHANVILATGASQFEMLSTLRTCDEVDWSKVTCFHLDEYVGIDITHGASFRKYLRERFVDKLGVKPAEFHYVDGSGDKPEDECKRLGALLAGVTVDVAFVGIGENGHLAFNDPPCNMETEDAYIVVDLDDKCRQQQLGEGWFPTLADVPTKAISMSMKQILKSAAIVCTVPDTRKAEAVKNTVEGEQTVDVPASFMQGHPSTTLFLDDNSASLLSK